MENKSDMSVKITEAANDLRHGGSKSSLVSFIKFISKSDFIKIIGEDTSLEELIDTCCVTVAEKLINRIGKYSLNNLNLDHLRPQLQNYQREYTELEEACEELIHAYIQNSLFTTFSVYSR